MGTIHHLTRYIQNLAQAVRSTEATFEKHSEKRTLNWKSEHNTAFENFKKLVSEISQNKPFNQHLETRVVTDASASGLGASL